MNVKDICSEEIPQEFVKWLLSMGCPAEVVPSIEKMQKLCRGQYNMIWKSMMEHVYSKRLIHNKRLQVFLDDISKYKKRSAFNEDIELTVEPIQLTLWKKKLEGKAKLTETENSIAQAHNDLIIVEKISTLLTQKSVLVHSVENLQRRTWLLQYMLSEVDDKKNHLEEIRNIAKSMCGVPASDDLEGKIENCLGLLKRNMTAPNNLSSQECDSDELLPALVRCRGDVLWKQLNERRATTVEELAVAAHKAKDNIAKDIEAVEALVGNTTSLQCALAFESLKGCQHVGAAHKQLACTIGLLGAGMGAEWCELLVLRCERACAQAKVSALRELLQDVRGARGFLATGAAEQHGARPSDVRLISHLDMQIESTRNEIAKAMAAQQASERQGGSARAHLVAVFAACRASQAPPRLRPGCDSSGGSDDRSTFVGELDVYLRSFSLEKNRKILLRSGQKLWAWEGLRAAERRLQVQWVRADEPPLLCASARSARALRGLVPARVLRRLAAATADAARRIAQPFLASLERRAEFEKLSAKRINTEISEEAEAEETDRNDLKKAIAQNLSILEKSKKNLDVAEENLNFWAQNATHKHISVKRSLDGRTFTDYASFYSRTTLAKHLK